MTLKSSDIVSLRLELEQEYQGRLQQHRIRFDHDWKTPTEIVMSWFVPSADKSFINVVAVLQIVDKSPITLEGGFLEVRDEILKYLEGTHE